MQDKYQQRVLATKKSPDFDRFKAVLERRRPDRPVLYEFFIFPPVAEILLGRPFPDAVKDPVGWQLALIEAYHKGGYDYAPLTPVALGFAFAARKRAKGESVSMNEDVWIRNEDDLNAYPWPDASACDPQRLAVFEQALPEGMKLIPCTPGGVFENTTHLVGFDNLCYMLCDDEPLLRRTTDRVGQALLGFYEFCLRSPHVGAIMVNDDWGYKTGPMISPVDLRERIMPWHRAFVEAAARRECPAMLHSCGNLELVMDDIIDGLGFAAKHSFEDTILPVEEAYDRWGSRIAILGGIDLDFVCRSTPDAVYRRCRAMVEKTQCVGYALGTGNQISRYTPPEQAFAMLSAVIDPCE
jgi:uroporphyrinogen decarboxylase